ncbi:MAG: hypothetical protein SFX74_11945 [Fimbriimonadaceae bacterium]|nr:hypothetical protein [Fimbriimonadaceae bacterium]
MGVPVRKAFAARTYATLGTASFLGAVALLGVGCQSPPPNPDATMAPKAPPTKNEATATAYVLRDHDAPTPAFISNGIFGARIARDGSGTRDGADLPFFSRRHYVATGEEKIIPQPNPFGGTFRVGKTELSPRAGRDYEQAFEFENLTLRTSWGQTVDGVNLRVRRELSARDEVLLEHVWVESDSATPTEVRFRHESPRIQGSASYGTGYPFQLDTQGDSNLTPNLYVALSPDGADKSGASRNGTGFAESAALTKRGAPAHFERVVAESENFGTAAMRQSAFDIAIDGPTEDQAAIRSMIASLQMAIPRSGLGSIAPMGLSSDLYGGHIFWDADIWMQPVIALMSGDAARAMAQYRLDRFPQAQRNYADWLKAGRPTGTQPVSEGRPQPGGAKFPWESSVSGRETVPGPSKFEDHITGSVAWGLTQLEWLGVLHAAKVEPMRKAAAEFYRARSVPGPTGREIKGTMSPDEHHTGDNDLYTNVLAQWLTGEAFKLPKDQSSFLTYDGDAVKGYKQAAAVLAIYPLQYAPAEAQASAMLKRFAPKVTRNGPAMTDSVHALIAARHGDAAEAYRYWQDSWQPFTGHALGLFSEKRTSDRTVFMTGVGGSLQAVLYGFAGLRLDPPGVKPPADAKWKRRLKSGATLSLRPRLPDAWKRITVRYAIIDGEAVHLEISRDRVAVTPAKP